MRRSSTGSFLKEILTNQKPEKGVDFLDVNQFEPEQVDPEMEALKLVLGEDFTAGDDLVGHLYI